MYSDDDDILEDEQIIGLDISEDSPQPEEYQYEVLDADQIVENMVSQIREVNSVVQLNPTITRILLNYFQWDKERLYERFFDGNLDALFRDAKISKKSIKNAASKTNSQEVTSTTREITCPICCLDTSDVIALSCDHSFCHCCWIMYLSTKIMEEGQSGSITCPEHDCDVIVDDQTVLPLVVDPKVRLRYQQLITNSYVECNKLMRWCPTPECGHAIKVIYPEFQPVKCVCEVSFCFLCGDNWHEPVKCDLIRKWKKKCDDDSETSHWIAANTKECPKCRVTIEKNGGCNHMICKNSDCKAEFCWACLGDWRMHGTSWYSCNRYDEVDAKAARDAQERSRSLLQRYLFYCKRYMNHMSSLRFENKLYASIMEKMIEMQQHNMSWIEVQFLNRAVDVLCQCRQTLMYTYVFAYYLDKTNQSIIFQDNQRDLEDSVEKLSEYLEREITSDTIRGIKQRVQDKYRYCASRRRILLEHIQEGYEQDWWVMTDY